MHLERGAQSPADVVERPGLALFDAIVARDTHPEEATPLAFEAATAFARLGLPLLEAAAREIAGDLPGALAIYRRTGATYDARRLEGARPTNLSTREREIASLAANGTANREIARRLAIHHKTVEKHLASVYLKLGISSRQQLQTSLDLR
jgi:DNA-binding NarL/FixJ family response regulator